MSLSYTLKNFFKEIRLPRIPMPIPIVKNMIIKSLRIISTPTMYPDIPESTATKRMAK